MPKDAHSAENVLQNVQPIQ